MKSKIDLDRVGACASAICAVHCFLTGVALSILSVIGLGFLGSVWVDVIFIGLALSVGTLAVKHGIAKHKSYVPALFFVLGLVSIFLGHFAFGHSHLHGHEHVSPMSVVFSVMGGTCLVLFHILNWRLQKALTCCGEGRICTHPDPRPSDQIA